MRKRKWLRELLIIIAISLISFYILLPIAEMVSLSFRPPEEMRLYKGLVKIPENPTLSNYKWVFTYSIFPRNIFNTILVGGIVALVGIGITVFTAYSISRFKYKALGPISIFLLVLQMFPAVLLLIPIYLIWSRLQLTDSYIALVLTYCTFVIPFCVWMLKSYFQGIPQDLEEAAMIDGCTRMQAITKIILPVLSPGIIAVALFSFVLAWQEFLYASVLIRTNEMATVVPAIYMYAGTSRTEWSIIAAESVLAIIPVAILFVYLQKHLVAGLTAGAVKG
ncbi:carbohydrate ABC transporter permease [Atribacter laminatus]|jgi:ABC-type glycerol-3-phosphate transport system permease component|uniref:Maltose/maltodextrin transport system permease protein MalG n=1 Tax=Atribacter laminatus TaxID=2847778 RepID=A0A7T1ALK3_ATRLM|nr:carbohydrate ABC transporter permease [Atribacter laminatus]QPM68143.1 Trehalose transport system permease protein SugB [Atribacter laminatus]